MYLTKKSTKVDLQSSSNTSSLDIKEPEDKLCNIFFSMYGIDVSHLMDVKYNSGNVDQEAVEWRC